MVRNFGCLQGDWWSRTWVELTLVWLFHFRGQLPRLFCHLPKQNLAGSGLAKIKSTQPRCATTRVTMFGTGIETLDELRDGVNCVLSDRNGDV